MCTTNPCYIYFLPSTNLCQTKLWSMVKLCFRSWWKPQLCEVWVWFGHMLIFCKYWLDGYHVMIEQRLLTGLLKADKDQLKTMCRPTTSTTTCLLLRTEIEKGKQTLRAGSPGSFVRKWEISQKHHHYHNLLHPKIHNDQKDHPPNVFLIVTSNKITLLTKAWGKGLRYYYDYMDWCKAHLSFLLG